MFCDGNCKSKHGKRCGLLVTETMTNKLTGEVKQEDRCIFGAQLGALYRIEKSLDGIHAAENGTRNAVANSHVAVADAITRAGDAIRHMIGKGFLAVVEEAQKRGLPEGEHDRS